MAGTRNHYERAFSNWLVRSGLQAMAVDERQRPVVDTRVLKNFDFLVNGVDTVLALDLKGRRGSPWITQDDLFSLMSWQKLLRGKIEAAFLFAFYSADHQFTARIADLPAVLHVEPCGSYRFAALRLEDAQRLARARSSKWRTYGFQWAGFARAVIPADQLLLPATV